MLSRRFILTIWRRKVYATGNRLMQIKTVKKLLIGTAALAGGTALLTVGAFDCLMRYAVARKRPRLMRSVARVVANNMAGPEALQVVHEADKALAGKVHTIVEIKASLDGIRLIGHWLPVENAKRIVIAAHGWRSTWSESFGGIADTLAKQGCSVLYFDQRGQNGSGGKTIGLGLLERYDCLDWVAWCCRQCNGALPVYLYGISMGAATVMLSAGVGLPKEVHGIIADCGYTSPKALLNDVLHRLLHLRARFWESFPNTIYRCRVGVRSDESTVQKALQGQKIPLLLIHGQADRLASPKMSERIYKSYRGPKHILRVPDAEHALSMYVDPASYAMALSEFWRKYDNLT